MRLAWKWKLHCEVPRSLYIKLCVAQLIIIAPYKFSHQRWLMVFPLSLSLLKSPGHFSVFLLILTILYFGWSRLVLRFLTLSVPLPNLWTSFQVHQLQWVSPLPLCSIFFQLFGKVWIIIILLFREFFTPALLTGAWVTASLKNPGLFLAF